MSLKRTIAQQLEKIQLLKKKVEDISIAKGDQEMIHLRVSEEYETQIDFLNQKLEELISENISFQDEVEDLTYYVKDEQQLSTEEKRAYNQTIIKLKKEISKQNSVVQSQLDEISAIKKKASQVYEENTNLIIINEKERGSHKMKLETITSKIIELENQILHEKTIVSQSLAQVKEEKEEKESLQKKLENICKEIKEEKEEKESLQKKFENISKEIKEEKEEKESLQKKFENISKEIKGEKEEKKSFQRKFENISKEMHEKEQVFAKDHHFLTEVIAGLEAEVITLKDEKSCLKEKVEEKAKKEAALLTQIKDISSA